MSDVRAKNAVQKLLLLLLLLLLSLLYDKICDFEGNTGVTLESNTEYTKLWL